MDGQVTAQTLLLEDFAGGSLGGWSIVDEGTEGTSTASSDWRIVNGRLLELTNIYGPLAESTQFRQGSYVYWNDPAALAWDDYTFDVTLRSSDDDGIGVLFRFQDTLNYYRFEMDYQRDFMKLFRIENGEETTIAAILGRYQINSDMALRVRLFEDRITVSLDDVYVFGGAIEDDRLSSGTIGLYNWGNAVSAFDDIRVEALSGPEADTRAPTIPTGVVTRGVRARRIHVSWQPSSDDVGVEGYLVYRNGMLAGTTQASVFFDKKLSPSRTYAYTVSAFDAAGNVSAESLPVPGSSLSEGETPPFQIVVLPDTQVYSLSYPEIFSSQTLWIRDKRVEQNIEFVIHEGDIVTFNQDYEWINAVFSMRNLDGIVPYSLLPGNHDMGSGGTADTRDTTLFNSYFPLSKYQGMPTFGGVYEPGKMDNSYHAFRAGGLDWLIVSLEFGPRDPVLEWANDVISQYPFSNVILATHTYLYFDDTLHGTFPPPLHKFSPYVYGIAADPDRTNDGVDMWEKLVRFHPNILLVLSGHVLGDGTGLLTSLGDHGNEVHQILANYQMNAFGGSGDLRILEFDLQQNCIRVRTYSPWLGRFDTDSDNQFDLCGVEFVRPKTFGRLETPQRK